MTDDDALPIPLDAENGLLRPVLEDVSVLIPTLGRPVLKACLDAVAASTTWPTHLIVIDQGANPAVADWLQDLCKLGVPITHICTQQRGAAAARNRGIIETRTNFVAAIDDDCVPDTNWLERMAARLHENPTAIITGCVKPVEGKVSPSTITSKVPVIHNRPSLKTDPLYTGNMGFSLRVTKQIGLLDETRLLCAAAEDNDWGYRALRASVPIVYAPDVIVTHMDWRDARQMAAVYQRYAWGQGAFYGKYLRQWDWFIARRAYRDLLRAMVRWLGGMVRGDKDMIASGRAYTLKMVPGILAGLKEYSRQ